MSNPIVNRALSALAVIAAAALTAFGMQLSQGQVPIPEAWQWAVPILVAVIAALLTQLPRWGGEGVAAQVDELKDRGSHRRNMWVFDLTKPETLPPTVLKQVTDEIKRELMATPASDATETPYFLGQDVPEARTGA